MKGFNKTAIMNSIPNNQANKILSVKKDLTGLVITIIGTGLIGGSMALALKEKGFASKIIGVEINKEHQQQALDLGIVDEINELDEAIVKSDMIIIAVPVSAADKMIISI